jgi:arylsulfatase A-like enzyme
MTWPAKIKAASTYSKAVSSLDLAATITELAGGKFKEEEMDGVNLIPFITGEKSGQPHESLKWRFTISAAMVSGDWKLVRLPDRFPMLYNLKDDLAEQNNLAIEERDRLESMLKELGDWDVRLPHPIFMEGARWKKEQLKLYDRDWSLVQPK